MKKIKKYQIASVIIFAAIVCLVYEIKIRRHHTENEFANLNLEYQSLVTEKDRQPLPLPPKGQSVKVPILMYHHVGSLPAAPNVIRKDLTVSAADFEEQVKWLFDSGYTSIQLQDLYNFSKGQFRLPKKPVIFTFDDGYRDVFENAIPILKKYGFTGSFGIITQYPHTVSGDNFYASWEQISAAQAAGNEIVCHTQNHFDGLSPKYNSEYIFQNLSGCQQDIVDHLGAVEPILIYPYGRYNESYIKEANRAGIIMGLTVHEGDAINLDDLMEIPRVRVHGKEDFEKFKRLAAK